MALTEEQKVKMWWALIALAVVSVGFVAFRPARMSGTPQEEAKARIEAEAELSPKIISKELVTSFHRVGNGAQVQTESGTFEFIMDHHSCVTTPEGVRDPKNLDYGDSWADDQAKLPIYLVNEDFGAGATYVLEQGGESVDDQCIVTPSGQQK